MYAASRWLLQVQQPAEIATSSSDSNTLADPARSTPEFYGTPSRLIPIGGGISARLVDQPDSNAPVVLLLTPATDNDGWGAVQSTLEQFGVASLVLSTGAGDGAMRSAADSVLAIARRRSQPVALLVVGEAFDAAVRLGGESSLADRPLVVLTPPPRSHSGLIDRVPHWLGERSDSRLSNWRGRVLIVRAEEETRFDAVAANALAAGTRNASVLVLPGSIPGRAPGHPDQASWRAIADFIRGVVQRPQEIVVPSTLPSDATSTPPADTLPLLRP